MPELDPIRTRRAESDVFEEVECFSAATTELFTACLARRRDRTRDRGPLFVSESRRIGSESISIRMWSKSLKNISKDNGVLEFTTHTSRDLGQTTFKVQNIGYVHHKQRLILAK